MTERATYRIPWGRRRAVREMLAEQVAKGRRLQFVEDKHWTYSDFALTGGVWADLFPIKCALDLVGVERQA